MPILDPATTLAKKKGRYPLAASDASITADAQSIGNPIDVIEPGRDQRDLKNSAIVEAGGPEPPVMLGRDAGGVLRQLHDVVEHHPLRVRDGGGLVIAAQRLDELLIECDPTQKLCVRDNSVMAPVGQRDHGGDHLVLPAFQRQLGRHQGTEGGEGVVERLGNQRM